MITCFNQGSKWLKKFWMLRDPVARQSTSTSTSRQAILSTTMRALAESFCRFSGALMTHARASLLTCPGNRCVLRFCFLLKMRMRTVNKTKIIADFDTKETSGVVSITLRLLKCIDLQITYPAFSSIRNAFHLHNNLLHALICCWLLHS